MTFKRNTDVNVNEVLNVTSDLLYILTPSPHQDMTMEQL